MAKYECKMEYLQAPACRQAGKKKFKRVHYKNGTSIDQKLIERPNYHKADQNNNIVTDIVLIAAASKNNALGKNNNLLWHLPDDFKRFKKLTTGHKIIMGRKTFESFPKPLPKRVHIIITRDKEYTTEYDDCIIVHSIEAALKLVKKDAKAFIIGGGEIYRQSEKFATCIEMTRVHRAFEADTFFPEIDLSDWKLIKEEYHPKDEKHKYDFTYLTYVKK